jgi:hypothetical protein
MICRLYVAFSPTPLLLFALMLAYIGRLEGWGACRERLETVNQPLHE